MEISNNSAFPLNGTQAVVTLPAGVQYVSASGGSATINDAEVIVTLGRLIPHEKLSARVTVKAVSSSGELHAKAEVRSATAMPVNAGSTNTHVAKSNTESPTPPNR